MYTAGQLAQQLACEIVGDVNTEIHRLCSSEVAGDHDLAFCKDEKALNGCRAAVVLLPNSLKGKSQAQSELLCADVYRSYAKASQLFATRPKPFPGVHPAAVVAEDVKIGERVHIAAGAVVASGAIIGDDCVVGPLCFVGEGVQLGERTRLLARVTVEHGCVLGSDCLIQSGAVIGSDGFGYARHAEGWEKIEQIGRVVIGNRVEIGANTCIDRGALNDTVIADGVILDNLNHIAHNVQIGDNTAMAALCAVAGSTTIGANCTLSGQVGVNGHIEIVEGSHFTGKTMVTKSIHEADVYSSGIPAVPASRWRRTVAMLRKLESLAASVKKLEKN